MKRRGAFITLEGIDGSGKSTHLRLLAAHLRRCGYAVTTTREPGGTKAGEGIRRVLLRRNAVPLTPMAELALMYAARAQHIEEVLRPTLANGGVILSDRYNDASLAYQGYGRGLGALTVHAFDRIVCGGLQPDLTLILDLEPGESLRRALSRRSGRSRFEAAGLSFLKRVRAGYRAIARRDPRRAILIPAARPLDQVQSEIRMRVEGFLKRRVTAARPRRRPPTGADAAQEPQNEF
jgi:dTMP kinase